MTRLLLVCVGALVATSCSNGGTSDLTVTQLSPGSECPAGGLKIQFPGKDPKLVCNGTNGTDGGAGTNGTDGTNGFVTLVTQTPLASGDARCPGGGVLVQSGLDNGADGGVARDGVLQAAEVTATAAVCSGDDGTRVGSMTPPGGAAGTAFVKANGGKAVDGQGGTGGSINLEILGGTNGGHVKAFTTGQVDATFTVPATPPIDPGPTPFTASTATVPVITSVNFYLDAGALYIYSGGLYVAADGDGGSRVTSLTVPAGVTLTFPDMTIETGVAQVTVPRSVRNSGTIALRSGRFQLDCGDFVGEAGSAIIATGAENTDGNGAAGGSFALQADGLLINRGTVDVSGGAGSGSGGPGGAFSATTGGGTLYNTGAIVAVGGVAHSGIGGHGGNVTLSGLSTFNAGGIDVSASPVGVATGATGATGGNITLGGNSSGPRAVRNTATLTANGADGTCTGCIAGGGGTVRLAAATLPLVTTGTLLAKGGVADHGGSGGVIVLQNDESSGLNTYAPTPAGPIWVSGTLDVSGGPSVGGGSGGPAPGGSGGPGGSISARVNAYSYGGGAELVFFGYQGFQANGGDALSGGSGGSIGLIQASGEGGGSTGGAIVNTVPLTTLGGQGAGDGVDAGSFSPVAGHGGSINLSTHTVAMAWQVAFEVVANAAPLDASGGSARVGGPGGTVTMDGRDGVTHAGALAATAGSSTTGPGASGGSLSLVANAGPLLASGAFTVAGGGSTATVGGAGGTVTLQGNQVHTSATVVAAGGRTTASAAAGGLGGSIGVLSYLPSTPTINDAAAPAGLDVSGGAGNPAGAYGQVTIDGVFQTQRWKH